VKKFAFYSKACLVGSLSVMLLMALVVTLAPDDVLSSHPTLARVSGGIAEQFDPIQAYTKKSKFPEITQLYFTALTAASPLFLLGSFYLLRNKNGEIFGSIADADRRKDVALGDYVLASWVMAFVSPLLTYFMLFVNPGIDGFFFINISNSKIKLALFGWVFAGGFFAMLGMGCLAPIRSYIWLKNQFAEQGE